MVNFSDLTFIAIQSALKAGTELRRGFDTSFQIQSKEGRQNLVTEYDKTSEKCIIEMIEEHYPTHSILTEESGQFDKESSILWIIDPLDGTVNFAHAIPIFSISIAVAAQDELIAGVIYQPMTQELFAAEKGRGAYLNGNRLKVSQTSSFNKAILVTGFPYNVHENPLHCIDQFARFVKRGIPVRRLGSAALDMAYVAAGRFDAFWEVNLKPWDVAAGQLLIEEAGGKVSLYNGSERSLLESKQILASNESLHKPMVKELTTPFT